MPMMGKGKGPLFPACTAYLVNPATGQVYTAEENANIAKKSNERKAKDV
jgi:hypothetical protein